MYKNVVFESMNKNETYSNKIFRDDKKQTYYILIFAKILKRT